jgi:hypothetical protein
MYIYNFTFKIDVVFTVTERWIILITIIYIFMYQQLTNYVISVK